VVAFAGIRLIFCIYRACTQAITIDEAYTYNRFLRGPWTDLYGRFDASNHVLYSILAKISVQSFGLSEFSLRLPSLIAGFFLTLGIFELLRLCTRSLAVRWLALVALSVHPLLLDFSIAARGYGMALAFLVWAIFFAMRCCFFASGVLSGLALSANLTMAFPIAGLWGAVLLLDPVSWKDRLSNLAVVIAPAETIFIAICFGALRTAGRSDFYAGLPTFGKSVEELIESSLHGARRSGLIGGEHARHFFQFALLPLVLAFIAAAALISFFKDHKDRLRLLPILTLALACLAVIAAHQWLNVLYPLDRTGLYLSVLLAISWAVAADFLPKLRAVNLALATLLIVQFATQLHTGYFDLWQDGSRIKETVGLLTRMSRRRPAGSVKISTSWYHQPAVEFYRERWNIAQWAPVEWNQPTQFTSHDFYIFKDEDPQAIKDAGIRILFRDPESSLTVGMSLPAQMEP
jgi:4-amino-4-deoxy-L-arabinose transferase-like glycosyltransferase